MHSIVWDGEQPINRDLKICSKCGEPKPITGFYKHSGRYWRSQCKKCINAKGQAWRQRNRVAAAVLARAGEFRRKYGLSLQEYEELLVAQDGDCAICGQPETTRLRGRLNLLGVDHDHRTGRVRGLLCRKCNTAIGLLADNPELLSRAVRYLLERR